MANEQLTVIEIGAWKTGFHAESGKVIVMFDFADRAPLAFAMSTATANDLGRSLASRTEQLAVKH